MGIILVRFRGNPTTYQQLEMLDDQIKKTQEYERTTQITRKKVAERFTASIFVYVVTALIFYFCGIIHTLPLLMATLVIISVRKVLTWWYNRKLKRSRVRLSILIEQKKKMLDKIMETETYKMVKEILEKFAPNEDVNRKFPNASFASTYDTSFQSGLAGVRFRGVPETSGRASLGSVLEKTQMPNTALKVGKSFGNLPIASTALRNDMSLGVTPNLTLHTPRLPMPRTLLPRERTAIDKMVDYLIGDGPSNRFALICKQCFRHNGMALREEFEYLSFNCCYCLTFNPGKKQRPPGPKLGAARVTPPKALKSSNTSDSGKIQRRILSLTQLDRLYCQRIK